MDAAKNIATFMGDGGSGSGSSASNSTAKRGFLDNLLSGIFLQFS